MNDGACTFPAASPGLPFSRTPGISERRRCSLACAFFRPVTSGQLSRRPLDRPACRCQDHLALRHSSSSSRTFFSFLLLFMLNHLLQFKHSESPVYRVPTPHLSRKTSFAALPALAQQPPPPSQDLVARRPVPSPGPPLGQSQQYYRNLPR